MILRYEYKIMPRCIGIEDVENKPCHQIWQVHDISGDSANIKEKPVVQEGCVNLSLKEAIEKTQELNDQLALHLTY